MKNLRLSTNESFLSAASAHCPACQMRVNLSYSEFPQLAQKEVSLYLD